MFHSFHPSCDPHPAYHSLCVHPWSMAAYTLLNDSAQVQGLRVDTVSFLLQDVSRGIFFRWQVYLLYHRKVLPVSTNATAVITVASIYLVLSLHLTLSFSLALLTCSPTSPSSISISTFPLSLSLSLSLSLFMFP